MELTATVKGDSLTAWRIRFRKTVSFRASNTRRLGGAVVTSGAQAMFLLGELEEDLLERVLPVGQGPQLSHAADGDQPAVLRGRRYLS